MTQDLLHRFRSATNMTDEIAALAFLDVVGGCGMAHGWCSSRRGGGAGRADPWRCGEAVACQVAAW